MFAYLHPKSGRSGSLVLGSKPDRRFLSGNTIQLTALTLVRFGTRSVGHCPKSPLALRSSAPLASVYCRSMLFRLLTS